MKLSRPSLLATIIAFLLLPASVPAAQGGVSSADISRWSSAWNSHQISKVAALFSADAVVDQPSNPKPLNAAGIKTFFEMIFTAYPDFHISVEDAVLDGWKAVTIERVTGHWRGPYTSPTTGRTAQPNGRGFDHPGAMYMVYGTDRRIKLLRIFWDTQTVDHQLGIAPEK